MRREAAISESFMAEKLEQDKSAQPPIQCNARLNSHYFLSARKGIIDGYCGTGSGLTVYGAFSQVVGRRGKADGQRAAQPVGRVEVAAEHYDRDTAGPGPLERGGRRLGAGAPHPRVGEPPYTGSPPGPFRRGSRHTRGAGLP